MSNHYNPTEIFHSYWVYCLDQEYATAYPNQEGKWMMFFPLSEMNQRWSEACSLYRSGKLTGINSMKASTAKQNPMPQRLHGYDEGIIIFYCGPSEDQHNVMAYGRNILNHMQYPRSQFYYKSDKPHLIDHSKQYKQMYEINTQEHYGNYQKQQSYSRPHSRMSNNVGYSRPSSRNFNTYNYEQENTYDQNNQRTFTKSPMHNNFSYASALFNDFNYAPLTNVERSISIQSRPNTPFTYGYNLPQFQIAPTRSFYEY